MIVPESSRTGETVNETSTRRPSLVIAHGLEVIDSFAPSHPGQDVVFLGLPLGWNENADRPSNELFRGVAEEALGRGIAGLDDAVQVLREDGVVSGVDDRREVAQGPIGLAARTRQLKL